MEPLLVTDLKQWVYCPRVVFYRMRMPGAGRPTYKMEEALRAQQRLEDLEMRRTLREYGLSGAVRQFGVWLTDRDLGLSGRIDLLLRGESDAGVVDFKLTSGEPGGNHRMQLNGYALLVEAALGLPVRMTFLYRIPDGRIFAYPFGDEERMKVRRSIAEIRQMEVAGELPPPTEVRRRCEDCEYANYCADIW